MGNGYLFHTICECPGVKMERVFPTKQRIVKRIHDRFKNDERWSCIVLFGSAVTVKCNPHSDLDLLVRLSEGNVNVDIKNEISEQLQELCDWKADIVWFDRIASGERIYENVLKGIQIV